MGPDISHLDQFYPPIRHSPDGNIRGTAFFQMAMVTILVLFEFGKVCPGCGYGAAEFQIFYQGLERLSYLLRQSPYLLGGPGREFDFPHIGIIIII